MFRTSLRHRLSMRRFPFARLRRLYYGAADPKSGGVEYGPRVFSHATCHHAPEIYAGFGEIESRELLERFFSALRES